MDGALPRSALAALIERACALDRRIVFLTGAGISADSGVPTFRGPEGYWTVGSKNYHPEELATFAAFRRMPETVWDWYLHRLRTCRAAEPNAAHKSLADFERSTPRRFLLITQNVDGLHLRAGNTPEHTFQIHGNLEYARCSAECNKDLVRIPEDIESATPTLPTALHCSRCKAPLRPNVLWFDECYDEERYRFDSSLSAAQHAALLIVIGTTGATRLPQMVVTQAVYSGLSIIAIDPYANPVTELVAEHAHGVHVAARAAQAVPHLVTEIRRALA